MKIENFEPFIGQHCETTATGSLLNQIGIKLSEPMLFGIGEGLGYGMFNFKTMPFPFIGGRSKTGEITEKICQNLNLNLDAKETTSVKKAWKNVETEICSGKAVGLQLDCFHLEYFGEKIHFAGHFVCMHGFDDEFAYLVDTGQQGSQSKTSLESLALARNEKGSMAAKNKSYTISKTDNAFDLKEVIRKAIWNNANLFLNPPIKNLGYKGITKTSTEIIKWFKGDAVNNADFATLAMLMERAGTGGALFRNLYRDFLLESFELTGNASYQKGFEAFSEIAKSWTRVSELFEKAGKTNMIGYIHEASELLKELAEMEQQAMEGLRDACA